MQAESLSAQETISQPADTANRDRATSASTQGDQTSGGDDAASQDQSTTGTVTVPTGPATTSNVASPAPKTVADIPPPQKGGPEIVLDGSVWMVSQYVLRGNTASSGVTLQGVFQGHSGPWSGGVFLSSFDRPNVTEIDPRIEFTDRYLAWDVTYKVGVLGFLYTNLSSLNQVDLYAGASWKGYDATLYKTVAAGRLANAADWWWDVSRGMTIDEKTQARFVVEGGRVYGKNRVVSDLVSTVSRSVGNDLEVFASVQLGLNSKVDHMLWFGASVDY